MEHASAAFEWARTAVQLAAERKERGRCTSMSRSHAKTMRFTWAVSDRVLLIISLSSPMSYLDKLPDVN